MNDSEVYNTFMKIWAPNSEKQFSMITLNILPGGKKYQIWHRWAKTFKDLSHSPLWDPFFLRIAKMFFFFKVMSSAFQRLFVYRYF